MTKGTSEQEFDLDLVMEKIRAEISKRGQDRKQPQEQAAAPEPTKNPVLLALRPVVNFSYRIPLIGTALKELVAVVKKRLQNRSSG